MPTEKEYMLEEATAAVTYQPKLTAGRNINISEDNVISSPDPPPPGSTVTVTPNQMSGNLIATVTVDSNSYNLYSPIPPVMTGATSEVSGAQGLVPAPAIGYQDYVLYGDGTWKDPEIPNIIANPAVSATTDLTKIYIDGTVYGVSGGGGGSSDFEAVGLSSTEYDELTPAEKQDTDKLYMVTSDTTIENIDMFTDAVSIYESGALITFDSPVQTTLTYTNTTMQIAQNCYYAPIDITDIDTIKYNLANSGTFETIYPYSHNSLRDLYIGITLNPPSSSWEYGPNINYAVSNHYHATDDAETDFENETLDVSSFTGQYYIVIAGCGWNSVITNFRSVSANSTRERNIYWNNNVWTNNSGGGGSSATEITTLLDVQSATSPMNLSDDLFNYDTIFLEIKDSNGYARGISYAPSILDIGQNIGFDNTYGYTWNEITSSTVLTNISRSNFYISSIVGIKSSSDGRGGGTEVIPNPTGEATEELTKIEIDGTIYSIDGKVPIEEEDIDPNDFVNTFEPSMSISVDSTTNKLTYQWSGGSSIGTCSVLNYPINLSTYTGAKVKITTGATAYSATEFYGINIGVRSGYSTNYLGTTTAGWILQKTFYDLNSTITYEFDFSTLTGTDNYFYICGGGWNFVVDEIVFYKKGESTKVIPNPSGEPTDTLETIGIDGVIYDFAGGSSHSDIPLELNITQWNETSNMSSTVIDNKVQTTWGGGINIGSNFAFTSPVFLSGSREPKKITYNVKTDSCWGNGSTAQYPRWNYTVGLCATPWIGSSDGYNSIPYLIKKEYPNSNNTYEDEEIDLSDIQDTFTNLYLVVSCSGWNAEISDIMLIGGGSGGNNEVIPLTQEEYDNLPSSKLTDNKAYFIKQSKTLDPNYEYYEYNDGQDGKIVVRIYHNGKSDEATNWFFMNYHPSSGVYAVPSILNSYYNTTTDQAAVAYNASTEVQEAVIVVNHYGDMACYTPGLSSYYTNPINAKLSMNYPTNEVQQTTYEDPYIWISEDTYKIIVNGENYISNEGGGGGTEVIPNPSEEPTDTLETIGIDGTVYAIEGGGSGNAIGYGIVNPTRSGSDGDIYYLLNGKGKKRALFLYEINQWICIEGSPKGTGFAKVYSDAYNTDSRDSRTITIDDTQVESGATASNFYKNLTALFFSGSSSYETTTNFTGFSTDQLTYSWGEQSGSTQQWFDVMYLANEEDINVLSNWITYTQSGTYTFNIPEQAQGLTADDFIIDFRNVKSGGNDMSKTAVTKTVSDGVLSVYLPVGGRGYDVRIIYTV